MGNRFSKKLNQIKGEENKPEPNESKEEVNKDKLNEDKLNEDKLNEDKLNENKLNKNDIKTNVKKILYIYVLECEGGKYYIGKTNNPEFRIENHFEGHGSEWTKHYKPIKILEIIPGDDFDEDKYTKIYMSKYGIENVRGGVYCQLTLSDTEINMLRKEILGNQNKCYGCGESGHFIRDCPLSKREVSRGSESDNIRCLRCGRKNHEESECYAKFDIHSFSINDKIHCFRCGRSNHNVYGCYAKNNIKGETIL